MSIANDTIAAVLLLAYGTPTHVDDVEAYYTEIRGGRQPTLNQVEELKHRYRAIGGRSPLLDITRAQQAALERVLNQDGKRWRVYTGMKHWHPFIAEAIQQIVADGIRRVTALVLTPHYSHLSIDGYRHAVNEAYQRMGAILDVSFIPSWHKHPLFIATTALHVKAALDGFGEGANKSIPVIFTAHSLPARIVEMGDPYPHQVRETCQAIADELHLFSWTLAYQSASQTGVPWLGPDVLEAMASLHAQGYRRLLIAPIGFVADNLETLYDIDVVYSQEAKRQGIDLRRMACLNDDPLFINALGSIIRGCTL